MLKVYFNHIISIVNDVLMTGYIYFTI